MKWKSIWFVLTVVLCVALFSSQDCDDDKKEPDKPDEPVGPSLPNLIGPIPYEKLGFGKLVFQRIGPQGEYSGVYVIDIDKQISWGIGSGVFLGPAVSPNGQKIAFTRLEPYPADTLYDVHIMDISGSNTQNVSSTEGQDRSPSWTPNSSQILFNTNDWVLHRQSAVTNPLDKTEVSLKDQYSIARITSLFSVSKDYLLTFSAIKLEISEGSIYTSDLNVNYLSTIATELQPNTYFRSPAWSPDGSKIAYLLYGYDSTSKIYTSLEIIIMEADGSNPTLIKKLQMTAIGGVWSGQNDFSLCWSTDGTWIAFNKKEDGDKISHIYMIKPDGSDLTQVTFAEGVTDRSVSWSR